MSIVGQVRIDPQAAREDKPLNGSTPSHKELAVLYYGTPWRPLTHWGVIRCIVLTVTQFHGKTFLFIFSILLWL